MPDDGLLGGDPGCVGQDVDRSESVDGRLMKCLDRIVGSDVEVEAESTPPPSPSMTETAWSICSRPGCGPLRLRFRPTGEKGPDADIGPCRAEGH